MILRIGCAGSQKLALGLRSDSVLSERTNFRPGEVLVSLERGSGEPLHRQIEASIRSGIHSGHLPLGTTLPASRTLALELGVSRGVVVEAYQQLIAEGYLASRSGGYTRVAIAHSAATSPRAEPIEHAAQIDFCPC